MREGLPEGYILMKDSERGNYLCKPLETQLIVVSIFWVILFAVLWLWFGLGYWSMLLIPLTLASIAHASSSLSRIRDCPLAINSTHPWNNGGGEQDAKVLLCTTSGWKEVGTSKLSVVPRQLSRELVITMDNQGRKEFGTWLEEKPSKSRLSIHLSLLKEAVALRNMFNGTGDDFETARKNEEQESGLLQREWLDTTPGQSEIDFGVLVRGRSTVDEGEESEKVDTLGIGS